MKEKKKQLTKAETLVMNILWSLPEQQGFIQDIIDRYPEPKPAYTTILTFMKILTDKGFVKPERVGKANRFSPLVSKDDYTYSFISDVKDTFLMAHSHRLSASLPRRSNIPTRSWQN